MNMADSNNVSVNVSALSSALAVAIQQATGASRPRQQGNVNSQAFAGGLLNQQPSVSNTNNSSRQASSG